MNRTPAKIRAKNQSDRVNDEATFSRLPVEEETGDEPERELVFCSSSGSIFGDTSWIDDALLREAIGGRFRC